MWYNSYWGGLPLDMSKLSRNKLAKFRNNLEFQNLFETYFTLAQDMFTWEGLPDTCDERFLERSLLLCGQSMIYDAGGSYVVLAAAGGSDLNINGYPLKGWGWGMNGFNKEVRLYVPGADTSGALSSAASGLKGYPKPEAVICYDNADLYPYVRHIVTDCQRMADLIRSCDTAAQGMKSPFLITCDEQQVSSVREALKQRDDNVVAIIASKLSISTDNFKVWPTAITADTLKGIWEQYRNIEARLLSVLGIKSNDNTDKAERLLVDEVNANNDVTGRNLAKRLKQRELFCERVNETFGLNISVHLRDEYFVEEGIDDVESAGTDDPEPVDDSTP